METKCKNGKIYKIVCNETGIEYIGSTIKLYLCSRISEHKGKYKAWLKGTTKNYCSSYKCFEKDNYSIVLLEKFPCTSRDELHARERKYIENNSKCCNLLMPNRKDTSKSLYVCECGANFQKHEKPRHLRSKKHKDLIEKI